MKGFSAVLSVALVIGVAPALTGCDLIEEADKVKEAVEDLAEYELKRAVEQAVEDKVVEEVDEYREKSKQKKSETKKKEPGNEPTPAGKMVLWNKKEIKFASILNLYEVKGQDGDKSMSIPVKEVLELEILGKESGCDWLQLKKEPSPSCRIRVKTRADKKKITLTGASLGQGRDKKQLGQCVYFEKKPGGEKSLKKKMGMTRIKKIIFND